MRVLGDVKDAVFVFGDLLFGVWVGYGVDAGLFALLGRDWRGGRGERVEAAARLREGDDVADGLGAREQRADPVSAERDAAVRRGAVVECVEEEAELASRLCLFQAHHCEHPLLDVAAVDTDGLAVDLIAVVDDVVGVG